MNTSMIPSLSTDQMIEVDRLMIKEYGILLIQMMENAGRNLAEFTNRYNQENNIKPCKIIVLCGTGNNGGGGMVAARHLHNRGLDVRVKLIGDRDKLKTVPLHQWQIIEKLELLSEKDRLIKDYDLVIDAMIGYGLVGDPRPPVAEWINQINASNKSVIALDAPSGINTTTGEPGNPCIKADATLTLALPKTGLLSSQSKSVVGKLFLADIGVPLELYKGMNINLPPLFTEDSIIEIS